MACLVSVMASLLILPSLAPAQAQNSLGVVLQAHRVSVSIREQLAVTTVQQIFLNSSDAPAEGVYLFPLPDEAAVSDL
ncbi:MAG: VIT domain-containing protein, partial [Aggregatilineales bacterium]